MRLSIIIPVLNEAHHLSRHGDHLRALNCAVHELIVVDGGSADNSVTLARRFTDRVMVAERGRASQMNAGARLAQGDVLLFLHADTVLPPEALQEMITQLTGGKALWGGFNVRLAGCRPMFRLIETTMNWRSRLTGIHTGDQLLFVDRTLFNSIDGFPEIPLMEDIAISRLLKRRARPVRIKRHIVTSSRRWERNGILRTIAIMWSLRLAYFLGVSPQTLHRYYYR
jgi:rSAM/selenodomain-associated transferase 2